jgi:hypothetical protein
MIPPVQRICGMSFEFEFITKVNFTSETKLGDGSEDKVGSLMKKTSCQKCNVSVFLCFRNIEIYLLSGDSFAKQMIASTC